MTRVKRKSEEKSEGLIHWLVFRFGLKLLMVGFITVVILTLAQCSIKKPEAPTWETHFSLPLINRTVGVEELLDNLNMDGLSIDSNGGVSFSLDQQLDSLVLDQSEFVTPDIEYAVSATLGVVSVPVSSSPPVYVSLNAINGLASGLPNDSAQVPAMRFDVFNNLDPIPDFSQAEIQTGQVSAFVHNALGVTLDIVIIDLYDLNQSIVIVRDTFPGPILPGMSDTLIFSLDGRTLSNNIRIHIDAHTTGGNVDSASTRGISSGIFFNGDITVTSAIAKVQSITKTFSQIAELAQSGRVDTASIVSGELNLTLVNATNLTADIQLTIPAIESNGQPLVVSQAVAAQSSSLVRVPLGGKQLIPGGDSVPQFVAVNVQATCNGSGQTLVGVNETDSIHIDANFELVTFSSIVGSFDSIATTFTGLTQAVDVPAGFENMELTAATLTLEILSAIDQPGVLDITIDGSNQKQITLSGTIQPGTQAIPVISYITDGSVADFLSPIPASITISGGVIFGNSAYTSTMRPNDYAVASIKIDAPFEVRVNPTQISADIERTTINQEDIEPVKGNILETQFVYKIASHLPIGAGIDIYLGPDSATLFTNPQLVINAQPIAAGLMDTSGVVIDTISTGFQTVVLDSADFTIIENPILFVSPIITLQGSNGNIVKLSGNDYINIIGRIEVDYRFDGKF
jgi:hypothetical protein